MSQEIYNQCLLERDGAQQVAWIESRGAKVGARVEIKEDGLFWTVKQVRGSAPAETIKKNERNFKSHRTATDI